MRKAVRTALAFAALAAPAFAALAAPAFALTGARMAPIPLDKMPFAQTMR
jgi:hypothetical protein